jgi:hypothetical protein
MNAKRVCATLGVASILTLSGATMANATPGYWDCEDFATPVKIVGGYDPEHLDIDNDGIGCEDNPGEPMAYDLYANLKGDDETVAPQPEEKPELADTGWGPGEHPIRWMAAGAGMIAVGSLSIVVVRARKNS